MSNPKLLDAVTKITAKHLDQKLELINADDTLARLGADELDLVEITMAIEDEMGITISDDELAKAAGTTPDQNLAELLTLRAFAVVASAAPKQSKEKAAKTHGEGDGVLRESQVGPYGELSKLENPSGLALVFVPSLEVMNEHHEQKLSRQLTQEERDELKLRAAVIALPPAMADEFERKQRERDRGIAK